MLDAQAKSVYAVIDDSPRVAIRCHCGLPQGHLILTTQGYAITWDCRHHGEKHPAIFPLFTVNEIIANEIANRIAELICQLESGQKRDMSNEEKVLH